MFRRTINASQRTDVDAELAALTAAGMEARLSPQALELIVVQVGTLLRQLVERGKQLAASGSQMHVTRDISGSGYAIKLNFSLNARLTLVQRLLSALRGR